MRYRPSMSTTRARALRRDATDAEKRLWARLRNRQIEGAKFKRQEPIAGYVADFACAEAMLIVELDGGQHTAERDARRTASLQAAGWHVLRFWNDEVQANMEGVLATIARVVRQRRGW
jgi:very-short-patch-repair endonuclease